MPASAGAAVVGGGAAPDVDWPAALRTMGSAAPVEGGGGADQGLCVDVAAMADGG